LTAAHKPERIGRVDPISLIVAALAAGAASAAKATVEAGVKDAYEGLKRLILRRYRDVDVEPVAKRPQSEAKRQSLVEDLEAAGAGADGELLETAQRLLEAVRTHDAAAGPAIGIDLEEVEAAFLKISAVTAAGTGVRVRHGTFSGGIEISDVNAGDGPERP
jgi:hypothetical protein